MPMQPSQGLGCGLGHHVRSLQQYLLLPLMLR